MAGPSSPAAGTTLGSRYFLQREVWTSRLGPVWAARDTVLDRVVHVQTLAPGCSAEERRAFRRAAAAAAQISHPTILQIYDIGESPSFVVFEPARHRLDDRLRSGPLEPAEAARLALALASGLDALHERGGASGALSPTTVLLDDGGRPKIAGAGLDAMVAPEGRERARGYEPPEHAEPADADLFALAALMYHTLTGRPPERPALSARAARRAVPLSLDRLLAAGLSQDPGARPTMDEFMGALAPFARPTPSDVHEPLLARTAEFRWLAFALLILALAIAAVVLGPKLTARLGRHAAPTSSPAPSAGPGIPVVAVRDFDPPPGDGQENSRLASNAADGNPLTDWKTVGYLSASMGGIKKGVGLLFDLGRPQAVSSIRVRTTLPGWSAEWRTSDVAGAGANDFTPLRAFTAGDDATIALAGPTRARYFLLWITQLVNDQSGSEHPFRAFVSEVEFLATRP